MTNATTVSEATITIPRAQVQHALTTLAALAGVLGHGWANFCNAGAGAATLADAFAKATAAQEAEEQRRRQEWSGNPPWGYADTGLRPAASHVSPTGRFEWRMWKDGTVVAYITRPAGIVAELRFRSGGLVLAKFKHQEIEARHAWMVRDWILAVDPAKLEPALNKMCSSLRGRVLEEILVGVAANEAELEHARAMEG